MGRAGWLPERWERRYLTSIARSYGSPTHRSVRVPLREGRSKTMAPAGSAHAACRPRARQKWIACSDAGSPAESACARNCSANASRPQISEFPASIFLPQLRDRLKALRAPYAASWLAEARMG
jgi:hypothetical protein